MLVSSLQSEVKSLHAKRQDDLGKISELRKLTDTQMTLLHQFEVELTKKEEMIRVMDR